MLAPGHHLYRGPDGAWRCAAPGDAFVRINGDDRLLALAQQVGTGTGEPAVTPADQPGLDRVVTALVGRGVFVEPAAAPATPRWSVHVEGDTPVADRLVGLLTETLPGAAECTVGPVDEQTVAGCDVVVSCAQWLPDTRWCQLDRWCAAHRTPWHGCYAEGTSFVLGPLSVPGRTASYRDTRGRRLAAAALPDELLAFWAYLDSPEPKPAAPYPPAAVSVVAGLLAADLLALAAGTTVPSEGHQLVVDLATASVTRHPVLPLPDLAVNPA